MQINETKDVLSQDVFFRFRQWHGMAANHMKK